MAGGPELGASQYTSAARRFSAPGFSCRIERPVDLGIKAHAYAATRLRLQARE